MNSAVDICRPAHRSVQSVERRAHDVRYQKMPRPVCTERETER